MSIPNVSQTYLERIPTHHWDTHGYVHPFRIQHLPLMYPACILMYPTAIPGYMYPKCIHMFSECISYFPSMHLPHIMAWHTFSLETLRYVNASRTRPLDTCIQVYPGGFQWIRVYPSVSHVHCLGTCILMYLDVSWCISIGAHVHRRAPRDAKRLHSRYIRIHQDTSGYICISSRRSGYMRYAGMDTFRIRSGYVYPLDTPGYVQDTSVYVGIRRDTRCIGYTTKLYRKAHWSPYPM
jgi:hypothetical protein